MHLIMFHEFLALIQSHSGLRRGVRNDELDRSTGNFPSSLFQAKLDARLGRESEVSSNPS
jgi:hypothetical protein